MTLEKDGLKDSSGHFVAGVAAGVAEWLIGHPLDTCVKQNNSIYTCARLLTRFNQNVICLLINIIEYE